MTSRTEERRDRYSSASTLPLSHSLSLILSVCLLLPLLYRSYPSVIYGLLATYGHLSSSLALSIHHPAVRNIFYLSPFFFRPPIPRLMTLCCYNPSILFVSLFNSSSAFPPFSYRFLPLCYSTILFAVFILVFSPPTFFFSFLISKAALRACVREGRYIEHTATFSLVPFHPVPLFGSKTDADKTSLGHSTFIPTFRATSQNYINMDDSHA